MGMITLVLNESSVALYAHVPRTVQIDSEVYEILKLLLADTYHSAGVPYPEFKKRLCELVALGFSEENAQSIVLKAFQDIKAARETTS